MEIATTLRHAYELITMGTAPKRCSSAPADSHCLRRTLRWGFGCSATSDELAAVPGPGKSMLEVVAHAIETS